MNKIGAITDSRRDDAVRRRTRDAAVRGAGTPRVGDCAALQTTDDSEAARMVGIARRMLLRQVWPKKRFTTRLYRIA